MTTRKFCDICDVFIPDDQPYTGMVNGETTLRGQNRRVHKMQAAIKVEEIDDHIDICTACIFKALRQMDPTPQEGEA